MNATLLEFEGQLSLSDIHSLTRKELYYLRRFRQHYHIKQREEADKAAEAAKKAQENAANTRRSNARHIQPKQPKPSQPRKNKPSRSRATHKR